MALARETPSKGKKATQDIPKESPVKQVPSNKEFPAQQLILGALFGIVFGYLLQKGGVAKYHVLLGVLLLEDFTVVKIMLTVIVVGTVGIFSMHSLGLVNLHIKPTRYAANISTNDRLARWAGHANPHRYPGRRGTACPTHFRFALGWETQARWANAPDDLFRSVSRSGIGSCSTLKRKLRGAQLQYSRERLHKKRQMFSSVSAGKTKYCEGLTAINKA